MRASASSAACRPSSRAVVLEQIGERLNGALVPHRAERIAWPRRGRRGRLSLSAVITASPTVSPTRRRRLGARAKSRPMTRSAAKRSAGSAAPSMRGEIQAAHPQQLAASPPAPARGESAEGVQRFERHPRIVVARGRAQRGQHLLRHRTRVRARAARPRTPPRPQSCCAPRSRGRRACAGRSSRRGRCSAPPQIASSCTSSCGIGHEPWRAARAASG